MQTVRMSCRSLRRAGADGKMQAASGKAAPRLWWKSTVNVVDTATRQSFGMQRSIAQHFGMETISACWERKRSIEDFEVMPTLTKKAGCLGLRTWPRQKRNLLELGSPPWTCRKGRLRSCMSQMRDFAFLSHDENLESQVARGTATGMTRRTTSCGASTVLLAANPFLASRHTATQQPARDQVHCLI